MEIMEIFIDIAIVAGVVLMAYLFKYFSHKINVSDNKQLGEWINTFVLAAEQMMESGAIKKDERKDFVLNMLKEVGGITGADEGPDINAIIEAAVYSLNNNKVKELEPVVCEFTSTENK